MREKTVYRDGMKISWSEESDHETSLDSRNLKELRKKLAKKHGVTFFDIIIE